MPRPQDSPEAISLCTQPQSSDDDIRRTKLELGVNSRISDRRNWLRTLLFQTACSLWIGPIVVLLILNFKRHIVGASAWCPNQDCYVGWFNPVRSIPVQKLRTFDQRDHNLLGALQFAAKALEVWFELIALALVYLITFMIAGKKEGIPAGLITRPSEFSDLPGLFDPLLWRTLPPIFKAKKSAGRTKYRLRIYLFIGFTIVLCILCNLMGPATAILLLPSLQWIDTAHVGNESFVTLNAGAPPDPDSIGPFTLYTSYCSSTDFRNLSFSCATDPYASQLDAWLENDMGSGFYAKGQSQERYVTFSVNRTFEATGTTTYLDRNYSDVMLWAPNRQVLDSLNEDYNRIGFMSLNVDRDLQPDTGVYDTDTFDSYAIYNRSLQLTIQRNGPVVGTIVQIHTDANDTASWTTVVDSDRQIRCYSDYDLGLSPLWPNVTTGIYTKCVRTGSGWSTDNKRLGFTISGVQDYNTDTVAPDVEVSIFSSDRAQFFANGTLPSWLPSVCLDAGDVPSSVDCDWDRLFSSDDADEKLLERMRNIMTIEMVAQTNGTSPNKYKLSIDFVAFLNFTTYQLDPSPITNPAILVQTHDLPESGDSIHVDPAWVLAAWAVDNNGTMNPDRTAATEMVYAMNSLLLDQPSRSERMYDLDYMCLLPVVQTLTLVDFTTEILPPDDSRSHNPAKHPLMIRNAKIYVWAYGLHSRTSKLGALVAMLGIVVVLIQLVLGFVDRRKYRSPTRLLVAALEHAPADEFKGLEHDEVGMADVRFRVQGTRGNAGKYVFRKVADGSHVSTGP